MIPALHKTIFKTLSQVAREQNVHAFVIGGYVRDWFLQRPCTDVDVVVEGSGMDLARAVARELKVKQVSYFKNFGTAMLRYRDMEVEFVGARRESYHRDSRKPIVEAGSLEDDQKRRDFTVNAMAFSLQEEDFGTLVDPFHGIRDLDQGLIRTPLDPDVTFSDDPLRMFRAIRFATQLGFTIVPETYAAIARNKERIAILSKERICTELQKIMAAPKPSVGWRLLDGCGLLQLILPELTALKGVETIDGRGHKDIFSHTLQVLDHITDKTDPAAREQDIWLRWAALLHDIGKAPVKRYDAQNGWTFYGHDYVGSKMVGKIFRRMLLPLDARMEYVQKMVALHMRPIALTGDTVTDSGVRRLLFDAGESIDDLMLLSGADITSKNEAIVRRHQANFEEVKRRLTEVEDKDHLRNFQPPVTGDVIMQVFQIKPGKEVGIIKDYVKEAIIDGRIGNRYEEAYALMIEKAAELGLQPVQQINAPPSA